VKQLFYKLWGAPPFETPPEPVLGPRTARTRGAAPQDKGAGLEARAASLQPIRHEAFAAITD